MSMSKGIVVMGVVVLSIFLLVTMYSHSMLEDEHSLGHYFTNRFIRNKFHTPGDPGVITSAGGGVLVNGMVTHVPANAHKQLPAHILRNKQIDPRATHKYFVGPSVKERLGRMPDCPHAELLTYWREPSETDKKFASPFLASASEEDVKYVTFEPDQGGWNNVRMQMEVVLVFALATGRTLVLPPEQQMYLLLAGDKNQRSHSFADFFDFDFIGTRVKVINMEQFLEREGVTGRLTRFDNVTNTWEVELPPENRTVFDNMQREEKIKIWGYLRRVGKLPPFKSGMQEYFTVPYGPNINITSLSVAERERIEERRRVFAAGRREHYYDDTLQRAKLIHFKCDPTTNDRLLLHFYTFLFFEDEAAERRTSRFVRDYIRYVDLIFCKAALIVNLLLKEGAGKGFSSFHVRRGDFQYKVVKVSGEVLMSNVGPLMPTDELLYIATDEKNKSFFDPLRTKFPKLRFLDDYFELANLGSINPNYLGMIDQVICNRGNTFVGTWFSTFTGFITRMRGYLGYSDTSDFFGDIVHRDRYQTTETPKFPFYMREYNISWRNIDDEQE